MTKSEAMVSFATRLKLIEGEELEAITFVRDYAQFTFGQNTLNTYMWPILEIKGLMYDVDTRGYRDHLCEQIGNKVIDVSYAEPLAMIDFGQSILRVILDDDEGMEAASFSDYLGGNSAV